MRKKVLLSLVAALTLLSSCSNDIENPTVAKSKVGKITFNTWSGKGLRAETTAITMEDFAVSAWDVLGRDTIMDNRVVYKSGHGTSSWDYDGDVFWPNFGTVYFYAISPAENNGVTAGALTLTDTVTTITYNTPASVDDMKDLLVAKQTGTFEANASPGVTLKFRHALARIKVDIHSLGSLTATVTELAFVNLATTGTLALKEIPSNVTPFDYPTPATPTNNLPTSWKKFWTVGPQTGTVVYSPATPVEVIDGATVNLIGEGSNPDIYLIPQTTTATPESSLVSGGVTSGAGGTPPDSGFYLRIKYSQDEPQEFGDPITKDYCYYIPVPALLGPTNNSSITFEMERQYNFTINVISVAGITFTASIGDYDETGTSTTQVVPAK